MLPARWRIALCISEPPNRTTKLSKRSSGITGCFPVPGRDSSAWSRQFPALSTSETDEKCLVDQRVTLLIRARFGPDSRMVPVQQRNMRSDGLARDCPHCHPVQGFPLSACPLAARPVGERFGPIVRSLLSFVICRQAQLFDRRADVKPLHVSWHRSRPAEFRSGRSRSWSRR